MKNARPRPAPAKTNAAEAPAARPWWGYAVGMLLMLFAALEVFGPALSGPFVFDDLYLPMFQSRLQQQPIWSWMGVRPLLGVTYWLNYQLSQAEPYSYHIVNIVLHWLAAMFMVLVLRKLLAFAGVQDWFREAYALFGGCLFLLHPAQTEAVAYVAARSEDLSVAFFLAAFTVFLYRPTAEISFRTSVVVLVLFGVAVTSKEHTVTLPLLLLLTDYFWNPGFSGEGIRRNWRVYLLTLVGGVLGAVGAMIVVSRSTSAGFGLKEFTWSQYFFTQCRAIWLYVRLFFLPVHLNADYDFAVSRTILEHGSLFGLLAIIAVAAVLFVYRRRVPLAAYGFFTFLLLLAPTSSFVPIQDPAVERRLYLPFIGLLLVVMEGLRRLRWSKGAAVTTMAVVLALAAYGSYQRSEVWSSTIGFWEDTVSKSPNKWRAQFQLGYALYRDGRCADSLPHFERAEQLEAKIDDRLLVDEALAYDCVNQTPKALQKLNEAARLNPTAHTFTQLGMIYGRSGNYDESMAALNRAMQIDPAYDLTYAYRGNLYASRGNWVAAKKEYQHALRLNPNDQIAQAGLLAAERNTQAIR